MSAESITSSPLEGSVPVMLTDTHPIVARVMELSASDLRTPWIASPNVKGQDLLPFSRLVELFKLKEEASANYVLFQAVNYQLGRWSEDPDRANLIVKTGPRQKSLKREGVIPFLTYVFEKLFSKNYPYELRVEGEVPVSSRPGRKGGRNKHPGSDVSQEEQTEQSSLSNMNVWLKVPRTTEWDLRRGRYQPHPFSLEPRGDKPKKRKGK